MKRSNVFLIVTGLVSLAANVFAIMSYFTEEGAFVGWQMDPGLMVALTFVLMAYSLATWSAMAWRWAQGRIQGNKRPATFLLNALTTFPLMTVWLMVLFSVVGFTEMPTPERWLVAMGFAWGATPFIALGLTASGEVLGPLLTG
ncbi:MAG: hypothetical protein GTO14_10440 [Anaerolineales bacterium]|nr:hypothetical protein [Anaerolineales bacterium]